MDYEHRDLIPLYILTVLMLGVSFGTLALARDFPEQRLEIKAGVVRNLAKERPSKREKLSKEERLALQRVEFAELER